jgi:hypothetical protein
MKKAYTLPDPTPESVALWLSQLDRKKIHEEGWQDVNKRFHGVTRTVRSFIREQYPDTADQEAVFDGLALALMTVGHFADISELAEKLGGLETAQNHELEKKDTRQTDRK